MRVCVDVCWSRWLTSQKAVNEAVYKETDHQKLLHNCKTEEQRCLQNKYFKVMWIVCSPPENSVE